MEVPERVEPGNAGSAALLATRFEHATALERLRWSIQVLFPGRIALVSSFGAQSAVLLHLVASVDRATPVVFVDTGFMFEETLAYRDLLVDRLGLQAVTTHRPDDGDLRDEDPDRFLWAAAPDRCCRIRKTRPLARALEPFDAWISGRKRFQADTRHALPIFEVEGRRTKVNPLADWSAPDILSYMAAHDLPRHELVAKRYLSIGCVPCTSQVRAGEDQRAGRWRGKAKVECGIHTDFIESGAGI